MIYINSYFYLILVKLKKVMKTELIIKIIYFLKFLKRLRKYNKRYSIYIRYGNIYSKKKKQKLLKLYIKYKIIRLNLNYVSNLYLYLFTCFLKRS